FLASPTDPVPIHPSRSAGRVDGSVRTLQQSPRDHLCLYLGCTLEDVEDAGVTENPRDGIFKREPIAAMDLHGIVRGGPGDARGQQLGHSCLEIASPALIFLPSSIVGELAGDHDLDGHHHNFVRDAWKRVNRAAELYALPSVGKCVIERRLGDTDGAGRRLNAGRFEGRHELLEALPLDASKEL